MKKVAIASPLCVRYNCKQKGWRSTMSWTIFYTTEHQEATILGCFGSEPSLSLPDEIDGFPVVRLGPSCFGNGQRIRLRRTLLENKPGARNTSIPWLRLPSFKASFTPRPAQRDSNSRVGRLFRSDSVGTAPPLTELGDRVFDHCGPLTRLLLPAGLTRLPGYAFADCRSLESPYHPSVCNSHWQPVLLQLYSSAIHGPPVCPSNHRQRAFL